MKIIPCTKIDVSKPSRYTVKEILKTKIILHDTKWNEPFIVELSLQEKLLSLLGLIEIDYKRLFDISEELLIETSYLTETKRKEDVLEEMTPPWKREAESILNEESYFNTLISNWNKEYSKTDYNWYMNPYVLIIK